MKKRSGVGLGSAELAAPWQSEPGNARILHLPLQDTFSKRGLEEELLDLSDTNYFDLVLTNAHMSDMISKPESLHSGHLLGHPQETMRRDGCLTRNPELQQLLYRAMN